MKFSITFFYLVFLVLPSSHVSEYCFFSTSTALWNATPSSSSSSSMSKSRQLLRDEITYSVAQREEVNILHRLDYPRQQSEFFTHLDSKRDWIRKVVAHHLNLSEEACRVADGEDWLHGSYNVCIPVTIRNRGRIKWQSGDRVLLRIPLPYRCGDAFRTGNGDEKVRCEAGTYAWIQDNCPDIPIPRLYGFAMSTGETFTFVENLPFLTRWLHYLRCRVLSLLSRAVPCRYVRHQSVDIGDTGYMLVEYVEETKGKMLSCSWPEKRDDINLRTNLYRDLSRIFLSLAKVPVSKIGSFVIDNSGYLRLVNRPLFLGVHELENEGIPIHMPRDCTFSTADSFVMDVLSCHDSRLENQPNAINDKMDYAYQAGALTAMRAIFPSFFRRDLRRGPFTFILTDLHQSNVFVDEDWNITSLVDLEWGCSMPMEMVQPPHWFADQYVDKVEMEEFDTARIEFMNILGTEEGNRQNSRGDSVNKTPKLSSIMDRSWEMGTFWYSLALFSPTGIFTLFYKKLQPRFRPPDNDAFLQVMPWYWSDRFVSIMVRKVKDRERYDAELREAFEGDTHVG